MPIESLRHRTRWAVLGTIRVGRKETVGLKEKLTALDYFVLPSELQAIYGEEPTELDIVFAQDTLAEVFPYWYKWFGEHVGLICQGDGQRANRRAKSGRYEEIDCDPETCQAYKDEDCTERGTLKFMLPRAPGIGLWELGTGAKSPIGSIVTLKSAVEFIKKETGRLAGLPLVLQVRLEARRYPDGSGTIRKTMKPALYVTSRLSVEALKVYDPDAPGATAAPAVGQESRPPDAVDAPKSSQESADMQRMKGIVIQAIATVIRERTLDWVTSKLTMHGMAMIQGLPELTDEAEFLDALAQMSLDDLTSINDFLHEKPEDDIEEAGDGAQE